MQISTPRLPAGQTERRDWAGRETGRFGTSEGDGTRRANPRNPAPRGDSRKEKGPGDYPGPWCWWRWAESNRRPKALHPRHYMLSPPLDLGPRQHGVRSAPGTQPVSSTAADRQPPRLVPVIVTLHPRARAQVGSGLTP